MTILRPHHLSSFFLRFPKRSDFSLWFCFLLLFLLLVFIYWTSFSLLAQSCHAFLKMECLMKKIVETLMQKFLGLDRPPSAVIYITWQ